MNLLEHVTEAVALWTRLQTRMVGREVDRLVTAAILKLIAALTALGALSLLFIAMGMALARSMPTSLAILIVGLTVMIVTLILAIGAMWVRRKP